MGVSQRQACEAVFGGPERQGEWSRWERGLVRPNLGTLEKIAQWGGVPVSSFGVNAPEVSEADLQEALDLLARVLELLGGRR